VHVADRDVDLVFGEHQLQHHALRIAEDRIALLSNILEPADDMRAASLDGRGRLLQVWWYPGRSHDDVFSIVVVRPTPQRQLRRRPTGIIIPLGLRGISTQLGIRWQNRVLRERMLPTWALWYCRA
jgi:hypothetical protein